MDRRFAKLERLISKYVAASAAAAPDVAELDRLSAAVEAEADRTGYDNHRRLMALHTAAEQAGERATRSAAALASPSGCRDCTLPSGCRRLGYCSATFARR